MLATRPLLGFLAQRSALSYGAAIRRAPTATMQLSSYGDPLPAAQGAAKPGSVLRRLARQKSPSKLRAALAASGETADGLALLVDNAGRNALHFAAWTGALENVDVLLDVGMDVNAMATGVRVLGKTPLFFAITRGRDDVANLLCDRGASLKIVNNKCQTPLSLAASHLPAATVDKMVALEAAQADVPWTNFRETDSDFCVYGDLDPRFLDRSPLPGDDLSVPHVLNPTALHERKHNFRRNNPEAAAAGDAAKREADETAALARPRPPPPLCTAAADARIEERWQGLGESGAGLAAAADALLAALGQRHKRSWLPEAIDRLRTLPLPADALREAAAAGGPPRARIIRAKFLLGALDEAPPPAPRLPRPPKAARGPGVSAAAAALADLGDLADAASPVPGEWVAADAAAYDRVREDLAARGGSVRVGVDTEWTDGNDLATIQLAVRSPDRAWVVDALPAPGTADAAALQALVRALLASPCVLVGFALKEDLRLLRRAAGAEHGAAAGALDAQALAVTAGYGSGRKGNSPSLRTCAAHVLGLRVDKREQCSDWAARPLREAQLVYAALDAWLPLQIVEELERRGDGEE